MTRITEGVGPTRDSLDRTSRRRKRQKATRLQAIALNARDAAVMIGMALEALENYKRQAEHAFALLGGVMAAPAACKLCGCTDEVACPEGCEWIAPGLCSECGKRVVALMERYRVGPPARPRK